MAHRIPIDDHKVVRDLDRVLPLALHETPKGNLRLDMRLRFIEPARGSIRAEVEFYDPQGNSLNRAADGTSIPLSADNGSEVLTWYLGVVVERAFDELAARRAAR
jgi:hypothetical protein